MSIKKKLYKIIIYTLLIAGSLIMILPLYWMVRSSLMSQYQIFELPAIWIPNPIKFSNYTEALTILPFSRYFINTILIVVGVLAGTLLTAPLCAYSFARLNWRGKNIWFGLVISSMMLPYAVTLIPTFIGWKLVGGIDTYLPLIIPAWFGGGSFNIFLLRQFFKGLPKELDEAAIVDGASYFQIYSRIIVPLAKPSLVVVGLFTFLNTWNDFLAPLIYINNEKLFTLSLGLQQFKGLYNAQWHLMMAAATIVLIPAIIIFLIGQKYFVSGIALTGLKG